VQGRYRDDLETVTVETECAHCGQPLTITFDTALNYHVAQADADPQVFVPLVDFGALDAPNIIDDF
jgi:hypothetical protein